MDIFDILVTILCAAIMLMFLVFIHEGGHFLAARAFGIRVSEFMIGFPGPGLKYKHGQTRFGITIVPLGGYAKICGMQAGRENPHLKEVLAAMYVHGTAEVEDVAQECLLDFKETQAALDELVDWGCITAPRKSDNFNTYRVVEAQDRKGVVTYQEGQARPLPKGGAEELYQSERNVQYCSLPFWKRSIILLAGIAVNLLFAVICFVVVYSVIGFDYLSSDTGQVTHIVVDPLRSIQAGFTYIGMVVQAVIGLFNPTTAADTISNSTSIVGIAVMSKDAFAQGVSSALLFVSMISISLGIMNLLPIPPLDGGRWLVEIIQLIIRRPVSERIMNAICVVGMVAFVLFFMFMINQDVQRFILSSL